VTQIGTEDAGAVLDELTPLASSARGEAAVTPGVLVDASYLVARERFDEFDDAVGRLVEELGDRVRITALGPLPPYTFADLAEE
jgi:hypothetical protein